MITKKRPTLGAVALYYILALGILVLFLPSVLFYLDRDETQGIIYKIDLPTTHIKYTDDNGNEYLTTTKKEYRKSGLAIGKEVKVYFKKDNPTKMQIPEFEGNEPYLIHFVLIIMALGVTVTMHWNYIKGKQKMG